MAEALLVKSGGGTDSSDLTATLSQVLSGYTAMTNDSNDDPGTGTMPNRGAVTQSLNAGGSYTIPQGYHNGSGKVTANSLSSQTSGNASSAQILTGYNAWVNGSNINGSMPNRGNLNFNPSSSTSQSVSEGYYSGGTLSSANAYNAGYNAAKNDYKPVILEGTVNASRGGTNYSATVNIPPGLTYVCAGITGAQDATAYDDSSGWKMWSVSTTWSYNSGNGAVTFSINVGGGTYSGANAKISYKIMYVPS